MSLALKLTVGIVFIEWFGRCCPPVGLHGSGCLTVLLLTKKTLMTTPICIVQITDDVIFFKSRSSRIFSSLCLNINVLLETFKSLPYTIIIPHLLVSAAH